MLFATYGAPPAPRQTNPLLIVLGVCGGCIVLVIIGFVVGGVMFAKTFGGLMGGAMKMPMTTQSFVKALENHNYSAAAALVDPSAQHTLTAAKIKAMEEQVEKKLGPIQPTNYTPASPLQQTVPDKNGKPQFIEYAYQVPLQFQKGTATAILRFRSGGMGTNQDVSKLKLSGQVTDFKFQADNQ